ncbi:hypothetical protein [Dokdonella sp.]|uniref:hypothetical protein n=1 Tax=Dokdonella sp. TaxID=2291710 RepID=UPI003783A6AE
MGDFGWTLSVTIVAAALVAAVCNALVRDTIAAVALSIACSSALWWYLAARKDPFWVIATFVFVPIIVGVSIFMGMLGRAARRATDTEC